MNHIKEQFKNKTAEQVYTMSLLIGCFCLMLVCAIVRLCGGLWFSADLSSIQEPNQKIQDIILGALLVFELTIVYKILCRTKWLYCIVISICQLILIYIVDNKLIANIINLVAYFVVPLVFTKRWFTLVDSAFMYIITIVYSMLFLVGRIGDLDPNGAYNFIYNVLGTIGYKLFVVSIYWFIKYYGGIKLWRKQRRLICQRDL